MRPVGKGILTAANRLVSGTAQPKLPSTSAQVFSLYGLRSAYMRSCGPSLLFLAMMLFGALRTLHSAKQLSLPAMVTTFRSVRAVRADTHSHALLRPIGFGWARSLQGVHAPRMNSSTSHALDGSCTSVPCPRNLSCCESPLTRAAKRQYASEIHAPGPARYPVAQLGAGHSVRMLYHQSDLQVADQIPPKWHRYPQTLRSAALFQILDRLLLASLAWASQYSEARFGLIVRDYILRCRGELER